jgi:methyl-accepting chemotaxis protein
MIDLVNTTISKRLRLIATLPTAAALLFAGNMLFHQAAARSEAAQVAAGTALSVQLGDLVHELQRERGFSAGFTSSKGGKFADELLRQRVQTDRQVEKLRGIGATGALNEVSQGLEELGRIRAAIEQRSLTVPVLAARYTKMVNTSLHAIQRLATSSTSKSQAKAQAAYIYIIQGKEAAGLERAMGATGFGAGRFDPATFRSYVGVIALQDGAFSNFGQAATDAQRSTLDRLLADPNSRIVQQYRDAAFAAGASGAPLDQDAAMWWKAATTRIEALKALQDSVAAGMIADANAQKTRAGLLLAGAALLLLAIGTALILLVRRITQSIIAPLSQIRSATDAIGRGELRGDIALPGGTNELSELGKSVAILRTQLREADDAKESQTTLIVQSVGTGLAALARGDLVHRVTTELNGPFAVLKTNFNAASESLCSLIGNTLRSAEAIRAGSKEISHAAADLARRTESNAATLEETSASLVEVDARVRATAASSAETMRRADDAITTMQHGRSITSQAVDSMGTVAVSARDIDSVIEGLDKIAFQTRVLAMNAAVEAGRAGEAGRGFAVVADLVSALAMRAEEEAKRAREQLTVTQAGIATAVDAVRRVDGALDAIAEGVATVHQLIGTMSDHNNAQSGSLSQITSAVADVDRATQQNAAMVEQTSAAAANLAEEVEILASQAKRFQVDSANSRSPAAERSPRTRPRHQRDAVPA